MATWPSGYGGSFRRYWETAWVRTPQSSNFFDFYQAFPNKFWDKNANTHRELQNKLGDSSKLEQLNLHRPFCGRILISPKPFVSGNFYQ